MQQSIGLLISGDPLPGDGEWGGVRYLDQDALAGSTDAADEAAEDTVSALSAALPEWRGQRCFEHAHDVVVPPLIDPPASVSATSTEKVRKAAVRRSTNASTAVARPAFRR